MIKQSAFWRNQKVLVTGASGFVGSRLTQKLLDLGANVISVVSKKAALKQALLPHPKLKLHACDLSDFKATAGIYKKYSPQTVFHLAASPIVSRAARLPWTTIQNNVLASLNVLESCRINKVKRVLLASSDKAYGDHAVDELEGLPYSEGYSLRGVDIYSASKVCADTLAQAYAFQYKMPIAVVRCCNIFGPGDVNFTRLIPLVSMQLLTGRQPVIFAGHEKVLREYIYVDDAVNAYIFLAKNILDYYGPNCQNMPPKGKETYGWIAFNVGSYTMKQTRNLSSCENIKSVSQVINSLRRKIPGSEPEIVQRQAQYIEIPDEYLDSSKLINLGFKTAVSFEAGINLATEWYRKNFKKLRNDFKLANA